MSDESLTLSDSALLQATRAAPRSALSAPPRPAFLSTADSRPAHRFAAGSVSTVGSDYYDAAADPRDADWGAYRSGTYEDIHFTGATRQKVLARFRREVRNNPYLAGLVVKYPEAVGHTALRSRTSDRKYNLAKELKWYRWAKRLTLDGRSLRRVERILLTELLLAGELFVVLLQSGRIQLIASEFCGSPIGTSVNPLSPHEVNGIVLDPVTRRPTNYRFGRLTRYGQVEFRGTPDELVEARFVLHVYEPDRVLMGRGLPWLLASIKTARDLYEITRSKTKQIKDANSLSGFIESATSAEILKGLGVPTPAAEHVDSATGGESGDAPAEPSSATPQVVELAPGMFFALQPGEKVNSLVSAYHASDYKELIMLMLHAVASPVGLPVELWFSGLGDVNYSGFKGLGVQWKSRREEVCGFLEEAFLDPLQFWRTSKWAKEGDLPPNPDQDDDLIQWGWRRAAVLDDEKAAKANSTRLTSGESSLADIWSENGEFPEEVLEARRQFWIQLQIAAGHLEAGQDHADVDVPELFLLRGLLPGESQPGAPVSSTATGEPATAEEDSPEPETAQAA